MYTRVYTGQVVSYSEPRWTTGTGVHKVHCCIIDIVRLHGGLPLDGERWATGVDSLMRLQPRSR